jgi:hypothetical protein
MKRLSILCSAMTLTMVAANAESARTAESLEARTMRRVQETTLDDNKPNEIKAGSLSYSGIAIEIVKVDNPFELINPAAPRQYGLAEANLVRDPVHGRVSGWKIFSIEF